MNAARFARSPLDPRPTRRALLRGAAAAGAAACAPWVPAWAQKAEFTYKFATNMAPSHPLVVRCTEMSQAIAEQTGGRLKIDVFPASQLGSDTDTLSQLRSGGVEFFSLSGLILATLVPATAVSGVGFAFTDYPQVWKAMDGDLGAHVRAQIEKAGIVPMEHIWDNGFRQITSSTRQIRRPADLKGFKIRVPVSPMWTSMFKALECAPASINFSETYSALQTRLVEGQENPLAVVDTAKLYEVQSMCALSNHMWDGFWFLANRRAWERLPADVRDIARRNIDAAAMRERADTQKLNDTVREKLTGLGMKFNTVDTGAFRDHLRKAGFYSEWKNKFGEHAWSLLEKASGTLG